MIPRLSEFESAAFWRDGFLIRRGLVDPEVCESLLVIVKNHLAGQLAPIEYEVDLQLIHTFPHLV